MPPKPKAGAKAKGKAKGGKGGRPKGPGPKGPAPLLPLLGGGAVGPPPPWLAGLFGETQRMRWQGYGLVACSLLSLILITLLIAVLVNWWPFVITCIIVVVAAIGYGVARYQLRKEASTFLGSIFGSSAAGDDAVVANLPMIALPAGPPPSV